MPAAVSTKAPEFERKEDVEFVKLTVLLLFFPLTVMERGDVNTIPPEVRTKALQ